MTNVVYITKRRAEGARYDPVQQHNKALVTSTVHKVVLS